MKWNSYGIIIFICSFLLTTTIEARGGGRSGGSRSGGGSHSSSSSSSSGWNSGRSSSSSSSSSRNTVSGNSPGYWSRTYDNPETNTLPSHQHTANYVNSYRSRPSATSGSNDFMHGFATGNFLSHGLSSYRMPAYRYRNNWASHSGHSDDTYDIPKSWSSDNNPPETMGTNELLDFLDHLNKPTNSIESINSLFEKIAKIDLTKALVTNRFGETKEALAISEATPETTTIAMPTMDTAKINELLDFLDDLNKPTNSIESINSLFEKIAKIDLTKALVMNSFGETTDVSASLVAAPETTTSAMPTMDTVKINELLNFLEDLNKPTNSIESINSLFEKIAKIDLTKALVTNSFGETTDVSASIVAAPETTTTAVPTIDTAKINELLHFLDDLNKPTNSIESINSLFEKIAKIDLTKALVTNSFSETTKASPETTTIAMPRRVGDTTQAVASSEATTDLPFNFESFTMKQNFLNVELPLISQNPSTGRMTTLDVDTEYSKLLNIIMSQPSFE